MRNEKHNRKKGLAIVIVAILISISVMPLTTQNFSPFKVERSDATTVGQGNEQEKYVDVEVIQYDADGLVKEKIVKLKMDQVNELKEKLVASKTIEERFSVLREYGLVAKESLESWQNGMYKKADKIGLTESEARQATSTYESMGILNLPILLNFFCKVNALYIISGEAHLGLPPIIGLSKFFGSSGLLRFDLADMCWGAFGMVETKGLLRTHTLAAVASFMALAGFVGVHIHIPFVLDLYNGFSAMTFAIGLGMRYINFNLFTISLLSFVLGALVMQGFSGFSSDGSRRKVIVCSLHNIYMGNKELMRKGKVKEVYDLGNGTLEFLFTDNISVFDKIIPTSIRYKGEVLCRISAFWFKKCEEMGIKTHFIDAHENIMHVRKFNIIKDYSKIDESTKNYVIPLEVIARYYVAGSLYEKVKENGIKYGEKLQQPILEFTTKFEEYDRKLSEEEAREIAGLREEEAEEIKQAVLRVDRYMNSEVEKRGLIHVDGKKEFAFDENRKLVLIDTFGTPDEDRFVRSYYREIGYYDELKKARANNLPEPPIPPLPDDMAEKVSELYVSMYEKITGESFR